MNTSSAILLAAFASFCCVSLGHYSPSLGLQSSPARLDVICDQTCTSQEIADTKVAVKGLNDTEATPCFADYLRAQAEIDQSTWQKHHSNENPKTKDDIVYDHQVKAMTTKVEIFHPNWALRYTKYASTCALDGNDSDHVSPKDTCYESETYRDKAMTIGHEISHKLGYEHEGASERGNERTVPYLVQYAICNCWDEGKGAMGPDRKGIKHFTCEFPLTDKKR